MHQRKIAVLPGHSMCQQAELANQYTSASGLPEPYLNTADRGFPQHHSRYIPPPPPHADYTASTLTCILVGTALP